MPGFLGKSSQDYDQKYPLSRENGNTHAGPLMNSSGAGDEVGTWYEGFWFL